MKRRALFHIAVVALLALPSAAYSDLIVSIQNSTAVVGQQGYFDIFVTSNSSQSSANLVNNYNIGIKTPSPSGGVSFTQAVTAATTASNGYIFPGSSPQNITFLPPNSLRYSDIGATVSVFVGQTFGVGRVFFDALAIGDYVVEFDLGDPSNPNNLSPTAFQVGITEVPATYNSGTIRVTAAPADVPEPSSAILLALTGVAGIVVKRMRRPSGTVGEDAT